MSTLQIHWTDTEAARSWAYRALSGSRENVQKGAPRTVLCDHAWGIGAGAQEHDNVGMAQHAHQLRLLSQLIQHAAALR